MYLRKEIENLNDEIEICKVSSDSETMRSLIRKRRELIEEERRQIDKFGDLTAFVTILFTFFLLFVLPWIIENYASIRPYIIYIETYGIYAVGIILAIILVGLFMPKGSRWKKISEEICSK